MKGALRKAVIGAWKGEITGCVTKADFGVFVGFADSAAHGAYGITRQ